MFPQMPEMLKQLIQTFREKGALSPETAMTLEELGLPKTFKLRLTGVFSEFIPIVEVNGKYYLSEELVSSIEERFKSGWMRHTATVPKGFLRLRSIRLLMEKPMSGSEIADAIEAETGGRWRPKPGSIYPLLARLKKNGIIEESLHGQKGMKRYRLTKKGLDLIEQEKGLLEQMQGRLSSGMIPPFFLFGMARDDPILQAGFRILQGLRGLGPLMGHDASPEVKKKAVRILNTAAKKIEALASELEHERESSD
ncbi:MAG: PadR family transcriptional regulator [Candidatus Thorarchaeota archaeon]